MIELLAGTLGTGALVTVCRGFYRSGWENGNTKVGGWRISKRPYQDPLSRPRRTKLDALVDEYMRSDPQDPTATVQFEMDVMKLEDPDEPAPRRERKFEEMIPNPPPRGGGGMAGSRPMRRPNTSYGAKSNPDNCKVCGYTNHPHDLNCEACGHCHQAKLKTFQQAIMDDLAKAYAIPSHLMAEDLHQQVIAGRITANEARAMMEVQHYQIWDQGKPYGPAFDLKRNAEEAAYERQKLTGRKVHIFDFMGNRYEVPFPITASAVYMMDEPYPIEHIPKTLETDEF